MADRPHRDPTPDKAGTVRAGVLVGIPAALIRLGIEPAQVLRHVGLDAHALACADNTVTYKAAAELLKRSAEVTGCKHFGLLAGREIDAASLGPLGELVQRTSNIRSALEALIAHLHLQTRGGVPTLHVEGENAAFGYAIYQLDTPGTALGYDLVMAFEFNILKSICGPFWKPVEVWFAHAKPADLRPYQQMFNCRLRFDADRSALLFNKRWLDQAPVRSDAAQYRVLEEEIRAQEDAAPHDQVDQARRALRLMVLNGRATEDALAALFLTSTRTLHRVLAAQDVSYKKLLDEARYEVARQLLADTDLAAAELAAALGYSDASAFNRASRRWTGLPPGLWRQRVRADPGPALLDSPQAREA